MTKLEESGFVRRAEGFSRRDLMRAMGLSAGGLALGLTSLGGGSRALAALNPGFAVPQLSLELDGEATPVSSAEGGNAVAEVIPDPRPGGEVFLRKHAGAVRYEDLILQVALISSKAVSAWISQTFGKPGLAAKNGALVSTGITGVEVRRLEFFNAVITEVTLAQLEGSDKRDPFQLTVRIAPEMTRLVGPTGAASAKTFGMKARGAAGFRFNIQGLEQATARTTKVSALTVKRGGGVQQTGKERQLERQFGPFDCSLVSITVPEVDAGPLYGWFDDAVLKGNNGEKAERAGRIEALSPDMKSVVATVDLGNLGIVRYAPVSVASGKEGAASVQVDMYCETLNFKVI